MNDGRSRKKAYREGDWFVVPLSYGGYALGLAARADKTGTILGFFFRTENNGLPTSESLSGLTATDAILVRMFGDLGIQDGEWPVIITSTNWKRSEWPMPMFGHVDAVNTTKAYGRCYDEIELNRMVSEIPITLAEAKLLPPDGLSGHIALIIRLSKILKEGVDPLD